MENYGRFSGEQLRGWVTENYIEQFYSVTYTKYAVPSYRKNREELIQALNKAHEGGWTTRLLQITHVTRSNDGLRESVKYKYAMNVPNSKKPGTRIDIFFDSESTFDIATGLWVQTVHHQFIPEPEAPHQNRNYAGECWRWYVRTTCNQMESNMRTTNEILAWNAKMTAEAAERSRNTVEHRTVVRNGVNIHQARRGGGTWVDGYG